MLVPRTFSPGFKNIPCSNRGQWGAEKKQKSLIHNAPQRLLSLSFCFFGFIGRFSGLLCLIFLPSPTTKVTTFFPSLETTANRLHAMQNPASSSSVSNKSVELWNLLSSGGAYDMVELQKRFIYHAQTTVGARSPELTPLQAYKALAHSVREDVVRRMNDTQLKLSRSKEGKEVCYLSLEFLMGRSLQNAIRNLDVKSPYGDAILALGYHLEDLYEQECDAGLGNGGLGRLAACFMDSLASLNLHGWGYGLRYRYGIFKQAIEGGKQVEYPDPWLAAGNPWEVERHDVVYPVRFFGHSQMTEAGDKWEWVGGEVVYAQAYDMPVPGYRTHNTLTIRLWSAKSAQDFNLSEFNAGHHVKAFEEREKAESITSVLYPNDNHPEGKELRLKQQYLFVSATIQDILYRFKVRNLQFILGDESSASSQTRNQIIAVKLGCRANTRAILERLTQQSIMQLNDTHPTLSIPELMRILMDEEGTSWDEAWDTCTEMCAYTNHTVLPEALEKWPVHLVGTMLPRHLQIIFEINRRFLDHMQDAIDETSIQAIRNASIIEEGEEKHIKMANLAIIGSLGSKYVNGVAAIHTGLLKTMVFPEFYTLWPKKFQNKTNGITPRRWLNQANPALTALLEETLGNSNFVQQLSQLQKLRQFADDAEFQQRFVAVKQQNKKRLAAHIKQLMGEDVNPDALFDIQIKRIHEYKRQLMNILSVIDRYRSIKQMSAEERVQVVPRVVLFAGKAAPGYFIAKMIINLINNVSEVVNKDPEVGDLLKVFFLPNYSVSQAEVLIPGADLSQQTSTAGMEASGTGNMKFALNGALIIGTLDGANIEIKDEIGKDNIFIFGATADEVQDIRKQQSEGKAKVDERFQQVLAMIESGFFGDAQTFQPLLEKLRPENDYFLVQHDFATYLEAQQRVDESYKDKQRWAKMSILSTAGSGFFSSDRTIQQYADQIWNIRPLEMREE
ncbi:Alpha-1,4 glucan phosphorylase [Balamuthia mandrillaris]